jgi:DNA-binding FadR family transcriptional regulator
MFKKPKQNRIFQDLVTQIEEAILDGKLNPGDRLPPERDLQEMFETSRGSLREALRVLEEKGLIDIRTGAGGGSVVKTPGTGQVSQSLGFLIRYQQVSLDHLAEFREDVEGTVVALAAERADAADVALLKGLLKEAEANLNGGLAHLDVFLQADRRIHLEFSRIAGNPVYASVLQSVHENIHRYYEKFLPKEEHIIKENYQDLCDLVAAVEKGQPDRAKTLARKHVRRFNSHMSAAARRGRTE